MPPTNNNYCFVVKRSDCIIERDFEDEEPNRETLLGHFSSLTQAIVCAETAVAILHRQRGTMPIEESGSSLYFGKTVWIHDAGRNPVDYAYITVERVRRQVRFGVDDGGDDNDWGNEANDGVDDNNDDDWSYEEDGWNVDRPDNSSTRSILPAVTTPSRHRSETLPVSRATAHTRIVEAPRRMSNPPTRLPQAIQATQIAQPTSTSSLNSNSTPAISSPNPASTRIFSQPRLPGRVTLPVPRRNISTNTQNSQTAHPQPRSMLDPPAFQTSPQASATTPPPIPLRDFCVNVASKRNRSMVDDDEYDENEGNRAAPKRRRLMNFMDLVALSRAGALRYLGGANGMMRSIEREGS
ncbi:hypothetical protein B0J14DRAFT_585623 [Halenospora varia]|nr:hypothetical protein B0J14DRAFT_585623 [Halenospora varia]